MTLSFCAAVYGWPGEGSRVDVGNLSGAGRRSLVELRAMPVPGGCFFLRY